MKLQNVVLPTRAFRECVAFYRDALSLPVVHEGAAYCFLKAGSVQIAIHGVEEDSPFAPTGYGFYLDLLVEDLAAVREQLVAADVAVLREWVDEGTPFLLIADPDGNRLELYSNPAG